MKQNLYDLGSTCELINDDALHQRIDSYIKWESNVLITKDGYNSAMVAVLYSNMLRHAKRKEWNLAANNAEELLNFVTGDNSVLLQIGVCLLKARRKHTFLNFFCKNCDEKGAENRCILYRISSDRISFRANKDKLKDKVENDDHPSSIGVDVKDRRPKEKEELIFDKDTIRRIVENRNITIKNNASKKYFKISTCVDCQRLNKDCPQPETVRSSWDRVSYFCPYFIGKMKQRDL